MRYRPGMLKQMNESRILNVLRRDRILSKADIARKLRIGLPTVQRIVDSLIEDRYLSVQGVNVSGSRGRPPGLVAIDEEALGVIGVELGVRWTRIVFTNLLSDVQYSDSISASEVATPETFMAYIERFIKEHAIDIDDVLGIGVASPGPLDPKRGVILTPSSIPAEWHHLVVTEMVQNKLGIKCYLGNNADAAALSEVWAGHDVRTSLFVLSEFAFGMGIVVDGQIWVGDHYMAGELANVLVKQGGRDLGGGRRGRLHAYSSVPAVEKRVSEKRGTKTSYKDIIQAASQGSSLERGVLEEALDCLGEVIIDTIFIIDPHKVTLGGQYLLDMASGVPDMFQGLLDKVFKETKTEIEITDKGSFAVALGAASLVLQTVYDHTSFVR